jgi:carbamoyltransferase
MDKFETIAIYGSHDASVAFIDNGGRLRVYEYERFVRKRYAMFSSQFDNRAGMGSNDEERRSFLALVKKNMRYKDVKTILYSGINDADKKLLLEFFPGASFKTVGHHYAHACSGYFASKFKKALIFSVDGGGMDNNVVFSTTAFIGDNNFIKGLDIPNLDFGNPYSAIGFLTSETKPGAEGNSTENSLVYAGKIMGLCAYGNVREEWKNAFYRYYSGGNLRQLCSDIGISYGFDSTSGQVSYDLAATSQYTFESKMNELLLPLIDLHNTDVVLVGGCALNVLYNQKLQEYLSTKGLKLFVPSNPNDCGEAYGMFLSEFPELGNEEIAYKGIEILDEYKFDFYKWNYPNEEFSYEKMVEYLKQGKIFGVIHDFSEVGPRALGNRSIVCYPSFPEMKDILNAKVKFREWYRPFAPVCKLEDKDKYFQNAFESPYMSYAPKVKPEFKDKLKSIVHADDTTRLQTTTREQHEFFYEVLNALEKSGEIPVILNTSFNIKGFPILTTYEDAFHVLDNTELDYLVINNKIFRKK